MSTATIGGNENLVTYSPIGDTGLTLVTVLPTAEMMGPIYQLVNALFQLQQWLGHLPVDEPVEHDEKNNNADRENGQTR